MSDSEQGSDRGEKPTPPTSLPKYVVDAMERQDVQSLRRVIAYTRELAELTPDNPMFTDDFDEEDIEVGDIIGHSSSKSTVKSKTGQVARVMEDEAVEIWDSDGTLRTIRLETVQRVSKSSVDQGIIGKMTDSGTTLPTDNEREE